MPDCMNSVRVASETVILCVFTETVILQIRWISNLAKRLSVSGGVASSNTWTIPQTSKIQEKAQSRFHTKSEGTGGENEVGKSRW